MTAACTTGWYVKCMSSKKLSATRAKPDAQLCIGRQLFSRSDHTSKHTVRQRLPTQAVSNPWPPQEHMAQVEQQMQSLQAALETGTAAAAALQATNATLVAERMAAGVQAQSYYIPAQQGSTRNAAACGACAVVHRAQCTASRRL